jgi:hypothetical protein
MVVTSLPTRQMGPCVYGTYEVTHRHRRVERPRTASLCARSILQGTGLVTVSLSRTLKREICPPDVTYLPTLEGHKVSTSKTLCRHPDVE